jgi:hypothetical protein
MNSDSSHDNPISQVFDANDIPNNNDKDSSQVKHRIKLDYGWKTFLRGM